jgi:hypothetical protein
MHAKQQSCGVFGTQDPRSVLSTKLRGDMPKAKLKTDAELIDAFAHGIEERQHTSVVMQSPKFVVFKIKGHSAWSGVGCPFQYVKAQHILRRKGDWWMSDKPERRWEGRVKPSVLKEALRRSELTKAVYKGNLDAPFCEECDVEMHYGEGQDGGRLVQYWHCDECGWTEDVK